MFKKLSIITGLLLIGLVGCKKDNQSIQIINGDEITIMVGDIYQLECELTNITGKASFEFSGSCANISNLGRIEAIGVGSGNATIRLGDLSDTITINVVDELSEVNDPYANVDVDSFYANYKPATSYIDSYYRTQHFLLSGTNEVPNQAPIISSFRPQEEGKYIRNSSAYYADSGNTYYILDSSGNVVNHVYRNGAYITLEEVAAYVMAFGDVPSNYTASKNTDPSHNEWGRFLRLNHTYFSGDTERYPYEPLLPDISGEGGNLDYYEIDLGTTGTDCDPSYLPGIYNDGDVIIRGAARIVYTRYDEDGNNIVDINEKYVFYTYNHYNDFQEYLNYEGGWGMMFGNITGGGQISSKVDYNPTPYVPVVLKKFIN